MGTEWNITNLLGSMDWLGKITGKPHISWENRWFPVELPLNQSIDWWYIGGKIAKLPYRWFNYGLWYIELSAWWFQPL